MAAWTDVVGKYIYDEEATNASELLVSHKNDNALCSFAELCNNEGCAGSSVTDKYVIYIDQVIRNAHGDQSPCSMDFMHGMKERSTSQKKFILGECRFNYRNPCNIRKNDIDQKVKGTESLLSEDRCKVYQNFVFLFSDDIYEQARSHFARLNSKQTWIVVKRSQYEAIFR